MRGPDRAEFRHRFGGVGQFALQDGAADQPAHEVGHEVDRWFAARLGTHQIDEIDETPGRAADVKRLRLDPECARCGVVEPVDPDGVRFQRAGIGIDQDVLLAAGHFDPVLLVLDKSQQRTLVSIESGLPAGPHPHMSRALVETVKRVIRRIVHGILAAGKAPHINDGVAFAHRVSIRRSRVTAGITVTRLDVFGKRVAVLNRSPR